MLLEEPSVWVEELTEVKSRRLVPLGYCKFMLLLSARRSFISGIIIVVTWAAGTDDAVGELEGEAPALALAAAAAAAADALSGWAATAVLPGRAIGGAGGGTVGVFGSLEVVVSWGYVVPRLVALLTIRLLPVDSCHMCIRSDNSCRSDRMIHALVAIFQMRGPVIRSLG